MRCDGWQDGPDDSIARRLKAQRDYILDCCGLEPPTWLEWCVEKGIDPDTCLKEGGVAMEGKDMKTGAGKRAPSPLDYDCPFCDARRRRACRTKNHAPRTPHVQRLRLFEADNGRVTA